MRQASTIKRSTAKSTTPKNRLENSVAQAACSKEEFNQKVQEAAYQLFVARGYVHGYHVEDWLAAEQIVKGA